MAKNKKGSNAKKQAGDGDFERLDGFLLNGIEDAPDFRDYRYQPALVRLENTIDPPRQRIVLDQGQEGACTGFAVAHELIAQPSVVRKGINAKFAREKLYWEAQKIDPFPGGDYPGAEPNMEGSTVLSAIAPPQR